MLPRVRGAGCGRRADGEQRVFRGAVGPSARTRSVHDASVDGAARTARSRASRSSVYRLSASGVLGIHPGDDAYSGPMDLVRWAAREAERRLSPLGPRWAHTQGVVARARALA